MARRIPAALLEDGQLKTRRLGRRPNLLDRTEMLALYDQMSNDGRKAVQFFVRAVAREERLIPPDAPLVKVGKA